MARYPLNLRSALRLSLTVLCLWAVWAVSSAAAEETLPAPWQISADRLTRYKQPEIIVAEGNVVLTRQKPGAEPMVIKADWMRYDVGLGQVKARGHVSLKTREYLIDAEEARLLLDKETGVLRNGTIRVPRPDYNLYISGREIEKTGELTYRIREGTVTSCPLMPDRSPAWMIRSQDVHLKKEGLAILKNATLDIKDLPAFYTPYFVFPANTQRKSGFLLPELSNSQRSGVGLVTPYFLDLSPSYDVTLYPGYLSKRGPVAGVETRYVASARSMGTFLMTYLHDRTVDTPEDDYLNDGFLRTEHNRYWLRGKANQYFGDSLVTMLDFDVVSDRDFLQEFRSGLTGYDATNRQFLKTFNRGLQEATINQRTSTLQTVKSWDTMLLMGQVKGVQDVSGVPLSVTPAQTLPQLRFNGRELIPDTPLSLAWDSELIDYWRKKGIGYQRLDAHPQLIFPIPRGVLEGHLTGGVRQTSYLIQPHGGANWDYGRFQNRTIEDFEAEAGTTLFRDFDVDLGPVKSLTHTVRPTLTYDYIPSVTQATLPYIDATDRIEPKNWLTYQLDNHFDLGERRANGSTAKRYLGYFRVSQTYDIREDRRKLTGAGDRQRPFSDVLVDLDANPLPNLRLNYETALSIYGQGVTYYKILSSYSDAAANDVFVNYSYQRDPAATRPFFYINHVTESERKITLGLTAHLTNTCLVQGSLTQDLRTEAGSDVNDLDESLSVLYHPGCWGIEFIASKTPDDRRYAVMFSLTGLGDLLGVGMGESGLQYKVL